MIYHTEGHSSCSVPFLYQYHCGIPYVVQDGDMITNPKSYNELLISIALNDHYTVVQFL